MHPLCPAATFFPSSWNLDAKGRAKPRGTEKTRPREVLRPRPPFTSSRPQRTTRVHWLQAFFFLKAGTKMLRCRTKNFRPKKADFHAVDRAFIAARQFMVFFCDWWGPHLRSFRGKKKTLFFLSSGNARRRMNAHFRFFKNVKKFRIREETGGPRSRSDLFQGMRICFFFFFCQGHF